MLSLNWIVYASCLQCSFAAHAGGPDVVLSAHSARGRLASAAQVNFTDAMVSMPFSFSIIACTNMLCI